MKVSVSTISRFLLVYCLVPAACSIVSWRSGQDISWDILNYHLYNPYAHGADRLALDFFPAGVQTLFSPLLDIFWFGLLQHLPPAGVGLVMGYLHGLNFVLVYFIASAVLPAQYSRNIVPWLLGIAALLSVGFRAELGAAMHDNLVSLFMLAALLMVLQDQAWRPGTAQLRWLGGAGLLAGVACACKLTMGTYALGLCLALLVSSLLQHELVWWRRLLPAWWFGCGVLLAFVVLAGPDYYANWKQTGNPVFPLYNAIFKSHLANLEMIKDERFIVRSFAQYLARPFTMVLNPQLVSELPFKQYTTAFISLLTLLWMGGKLLRLRRPEPVLALTRMQRIFLLYMLLSFALWLQMFAYYRYLIAWELLAPLAITLLLVNLAGNKWGLSMAGVSLVILTAVNYPGAPDWGHSAWSDKYYSAEVPQDLAATSTVLLMGMPLAWLVPTLDRDIPFIQIDPNFPVRQSDYGAQALGHIDTSGELKVIFDAGLYSVAQVQQKLSQGNYQLVPSSCTILQTWLGAQELQYQYCQVVAL